MSGPKVDVLQILSACAHGAAFGAHYATARDIDAAREAVAELIAAATQAKRAYWLARNSAAGLTNYCEDSASSHRCGRELSEAESVWRSAGLDAALAATGETK